jgi:dienelactone hydrolase
MFHKGVTLRGDPAEFVEINYENSSMPAVFMKAKGDEPAPCIIHFNGFDWIKELNYLLLAQDYSERGFASLFCDQPGSGGSLRLHGIKADYASEKAAKACIDYLETRNDVDKSNIGIQAASLGGYYAPRAAAFEHRLAFCTISGAFYDGMDVMRMRLEKGKDYAN